MYITVSVTKEDWVVGGRTQFFFYINLFVLEHGGADQNQNEGACDGRLRGWTNKLKIKKEKSIDF